jgi:hypothetical protein
MPYSGNSWQQLVVGLFQVVQYVPAATYKSTDGIRRVRIYKLTARGAKHVEHEVSRFEKMLERITRVLAPGES